MDCYSPKPPLPRKLTLVLCVLYPDSDLPWLGQTAYLGPKGTDVSDPRMHEANPYPVEPAHPPSFHTPSNLLWAKESVLQVGNSWNPQSLLLGPRKCVTGVLFCMSGVFVVK